MFRWVQSFRFLKLAQMSKINLSYLLKRKQLDRIIISIGKPLRDVAIIEQFYYTSALKKKLFLEIIKLCKKSVLIR